MWLAVTTCWSAGQRVRVAARAGQPVVGGQQVLDVAGHLHPRVDEHDEVVTGALDVGDQVRGEHHAELLVGHRLHEVLEELAAGQRVEAGHRLVEEQQLGPLGDAQGQGELRALAAREPPGSLLGVEPEPRDALARPGWRPTPG